MKRKTKNNIYKLIIIAVIIIGAIFSKDYLNYDKNDEAINNLNSKSSVTTSEENPLINVDGNLQIHFIDQTTPNMIQRISEIFERKPLISKEI